MQFSSPPPDKSPNGEKGSRAALALRLSHAAGELNPFLMVLAIGLLLLNLTLYLGLAAARTPFVWTSPHQVEGRAAKVTAPPPIDPAAFAR